uniref:NADH-ubiquinone oxidoreductase chain 6 n=1 Tax=Cucujoidea sp. 38 KM-2017 TaxID=2219376 RepID=A0A346RHT1_9CUCU|nr:NADH dehydrogenase subunit 6 [Cucujoidea sp. 38 KM-2017]
MLLLMSFNLSMTLMFMFMKHPLSMGCILMIQTINISLMTGLMNLNFWYSYILFLVMVGGMLILFIYMTSIASNEKFKFNNKLMSIPIITIMLNFSLLMDQFYFNLNIINETINNKILINNLSMMKYLNLPSNMIYLMIIFYLLITMIAIVKITETKSGPLRQMS